MLQTQTLSRVRALRAGLALVGALGLLTAAGCGSKEPPDVRHHEQGKIYLQKTRDYAKAAREFEKALEINPKRPDTVYLLGRTYLLSQRYEEALKTFNDLATDLSDTRQARLGWMETHRVRARRRLAEAGTFKEIEEFAEIEDDLAAAAQHAVAYTQANPTDPEGLLRQAGVAEERYRFHAARRAFLLKQADRARELGNDAEADARQREARDEDQQVATQVEAASTLYERVIALDKQNVTAYRRLIENARALRALDRAETPARRLLEVQPDSDVALLALAEIALHKWDRTRTKEPLEEARQYAERVLTATPGHEQANLVMARYGLASEQYDVAVEHAQSVLARNPKHQVGLYLQGMAYFRKRNYDMAILSLQRLVRPGVRWGDPKQESPVWFCLAVSYRETQNPQQALSALNQAVRADPQNVEAIEELGKAYLKEGRLDAARDLVTRYANAANPALGQFLLAMTYEAEAREKWAKREDQAFRELVQKARLCYDKAAELAPDSPLAQLRRVMKLLPERRYEEAIKECDTALSVNPNNYEMRYRKAWAQAELGRLTEAIQTCRENLTRNPGDDRSHLLITDIYVRYGRPDLAIRYAETAPAAAVGHFIDRRLAVLYLQRAQTQPEGAEADLKAAKDAANRVLAKLPDDPLMLLMGAEAHRRLGEYTAAQALLDRAVGLYPKDAQVLHAAGDAAIPGGDLARAQAMFERALQANPEQVVSVYPLGMVLVARGQAEEAAKRFRDATRFPSLQARHYFGLVVSLCAAGKAEEAAATAARVAEAVGPSEALGTARVMALMGLGKHQEALAALEDMDRRHQAIGHPLDPNSLRHLRVLLEAVKDDPDRARQVALEANLADFYRHGPWNDRALEAAKRALEVVPESVNRMRVVLTCLEAGGAANNQQALEVAQQIAKADDTWPGVHAVLANQYERAGRFDDAERELKRTIELAPDAVNLRFRLGALYERRANKEQAQRTAYRNKALAEYRATAEMPNIERDPATAYQVYNNLAYLLAVHAGDVPAALQVAAKAKAVAEAYPALMRNPRLHGTVLDTIGWIEHLAGNHREALQNLERANILYPFNSTLLYHLGAAYLAVGDRPNARRYLAEAIGTAPDEGFEHLEDAKRALAVLEAA